MITAERLREFLDYDPETGVFRWRLSRRIVKSGSVAGWLNRGYRYIKIEDKNYGAHRLVWLWVHGCWPMGQIDHRDGVPDNNRIANLREATGAQNQYNTKLRSNNRSGFKGVSWFARDRKWRAEIRVRGRKVHLGSFVMVEKAHAAYRAAAFRFRGEFARTDGFATTIGELKLKAAAYG